MAVNNLMYSRKLEELLGKGISVEEAHKQATEYATIKIAKQTRAVKMGKSKEYKQYVKNVKRMGGKEIATPEQYRKIQRRLGKKSPIARAVAKKRKPSNDYATVRTKAVSGSLRSAGLTEEEIRRLRGK